MTNSAQDNYLNDLEGDITPEQASKLLELGELLDDEQAEEQTTAEAKNESTPPQTAGEQELNTQEQTDYQQQLEQERAERLALQAKLDMLLAQQNTPAPQQTPSQEPTGEQEPQQLFGDFSEEALKQGINHLVQQQVQEIIEKHIAPLEQKQEQDAYQAHLQSILDVHSDAQELVASDAFADWVKQQPSYITQSIVSVLDHGSSSEIIDVLNSYKQAISTKQAGEMATTDGTAKATADAITNNTPAPTPNSLSDLGGSSPTNIDPISSMASAQAIEAMANWTPEQITKYLNSL